MGVTYSEESIKRVSEAEERFLDCINSSQRGVYENVILPILMPERVSYEERRLPQFNAELAKRWITKRAYEYGWNNKRFPRDRSNYSSSRERPKVERIGKKYQWLALSEFLARLSDNVWAISGWPEQARAYDHPARDWFVRNVEPSILLDPSSNTRENCWWQTVPLELDPIGEAQLKNWPFSGAPLATSAWIDVPTPHGIRWLLLYGFFNLREDEGEGGRSVLTAKRDIFVRVSTILAQADGVSGVIAKLKGCRLADPSGHETLDWIDGPFLCEYPWRNTWDSDYGIYDEDDTGSFAGLRYIRPIARHIWEGHLDGSLEEGSRVCVPHPWIGRELGLRPDLNKIGTFVAGESDKPLFLDPTAGASTSSAAIIEPQTFFEFLNKHKLECLWITAGERNAWPSGYRGDYSCRSFAGIHRWMGDHWESLQWHTDTSSHRDC